MAQVLGRPISLRRGLFYAVAIALLLVLVVDPTILWPLDPNDLNPTKRLASPSFSHPMGTDELGSDLLARVLASVKLEFGIALGSVLLGAAFAIPAGLIAGFRGGFLDDGISMLSSAFFAFPEVLLAVLIVASIGPSLGTLMLVLAIVFWPRVYQLVRDQTVAIRQRGYIVAARLNGAGVVRIISRHVLPNIAGPLAVMLPLRMSTAILIEAGLSYLGLGVQPPELSWGTLLHASQRYFTVAPWYALAPGLIVTLSAFALMFMGDRIARRLDPRDSSGTGWSQSMSGSTEAPGEGA